MSENTEVQGYYDPSIGALGLIMRVVGAVGTTPITRTEGEKSERPA